MRQVRRRGKLGRVARFGVAVGGALLLFSVAVVAALRWIDPPTTAFVIRHNSLAADRPDLTPASLSWTDWDEIAPSMPLAVVASEDQRFLSHWGFDLRAISDALAEHRRGERLRGASTISQQVAKNLFLWPGRSFIRKGLEAYLTGLIELLWPKQRILEVYLNVAQFGTNTFGVGPASREFFYRSPAALRPSQAATLAAVLPNPHGLSASRPSSYVRERRVWILRHMRQLGGPSYLAGM